MYAINRDYFRGNITYMDTTNWLATQLISIVIQAFFVLGVILLSYK